MQFFVGSTNPVKLNAVKQATICHWPDSSITGFEVESQVREQPLTDEETKQGAINRAKNAYALGLSKQKDQPQTSAKNILSVGLEGGVMLIQDKMWTTIWTAVVDSQNNQYLANGGKFVVPQFLADQILQGAEMGPAISKYFNGRSVKTQEGLVGVITKNFLDRTELYSAIVKLAIGQWYGRDWQKKLTR